MASRATLLRVMDSVGISPLAGLKLPWDLLRLHIQVKIRISGLETDILALLYAIRILRGAPVGQFREVGPGAMRLLTEAMRVHRELVCIARVFQLSNGTYNTPNIETVRRQINFLMSVSRSHRDSIRGVIAPMARTVIHWGFGTSGEPTLPTYCPLDDTEELVAEVILPDTPPPDPIPINEPVVIDLTVD